MTGLTELLVRRISTQGPITIADYMTEALMHPTLGYYSTSEPFGAKGDFVTAPEISQMFGELIGLALAQAWLDQGAPDAFSLAELGPGRGTLMADIWRATARVPGFHAAARVIMVESAEQLRAVQRRAVPDVAHLDHVDDLPQAPLFLIANEFFDALPIRQFTRSGDGWCETLVGQQDGALRLGKGPQTALGAVAHRLADTREGDVVEICPALPGMVSAIGSRIAQHGGLALIIDYGDWTSLGDTLQAMRQHAPVGLLDTPGKADLTAHVDFAAIAAAAAPARHSRLTPQGVFLERLGITARARVIAENLTGPALEAHIAAHRRLTHPSEMGDHFKVIGLWPDGAEPPAGLMP